MMLINTSKGYRRGNAKANVIHICGRNLSGEFPELTRTIPMKYVLKLGEYAEYISRI